MAAPANSLTAREESVLELLRRRWSNAEIAAELVISVRTVESHVSSILRKSGVRDRGSLIADSETIIRFVEVSGGSALAVSEEGRGPTLVKTATWLTQVDKDSPTSPIWGHWVRELGRRYRYVRYDPRGCGLSDRDLRAADLSDLSLWIEDLRTILDTVADGPVALLGVSQGGPVAFGFAAMYPERVSHLVLYGTYALGMRRRGDPAQADEATLQRDLAKVAWRSDSDRFRETFARQFVPEGTPQEIDWFNEQLRSTTSAENAPLLESAFHDLDATDLARAVTVPTLVLHATGDRGVPFEQGRHVAGLIPSAHFVALDSRNHILLQRDLAFARFLWEVERFLRT